MRTRNYRFKTSPHLLRRHAGRCLLATTLLALAACGPDGATAPGSQPRQLHGATSTIATSAAEQLLYEQLPLPSTNLFTGGTSYEVVAFDFVVPPGGHWRMSRVVLIGLGFPGPQGVGDFQINLFRDDGTGHLGQILSSSIGAVPTGTPNPCCGGEVFDYSWNAITKDLAPGRYWLTNRLSDNSRRFNPQLAVAVGYPGLIGDPFYTPMVPISVAAPNNDFAFKVYGTVESAAEAATNLLATIQGFALPSGTFTSLQAKLTSAQTALDAGDSAAACRAFQDLINATMALSGKKLTAAQATTIIDEATRIRTIIGC